MPSNYSMELIIAYVLPTHLFSKKGQHSVKNVTLLLTVSVSQ